MFGPDGYPAARLPDVVEPSIAYPGLDGLDGLRQIDRLVTDMGYGVRKPSFLLHPAQPNRTLVVYQHGYAGTFLDVKRHLSALLQRGYTVLAMNLLSYDAGTWPKEMRIEGIGWYPVRPHDLPAFFAHPMRFWFEPAVASLNHALGSGAYDRAFMLGFSMGGWTTQLLSAMDPRIVRSYPVAGGYPLYLRAGERNEAPPPALYGPMVRAASYLDMYVLAADAPGRRQLQIFNRFDRCCYRNTKALLYEPAVREAIAAIGGGSFTVVLDETHADHILSDHAMALILEDMAAGG
jgi:pimeloyl-ACP methyl ester carboxylesterase